MNFYSGPMLFFRLTCILLISQVNPTFAKEPIINTTWIDNSGEHNLVIEKEMTKDQTEEHLSVKQLTKDNVDWVLNDYVNDCVLDIKLDVVPDSVEVNKTLSDGMDTVLFAYKIGCIGGLDPVTVKYFAYKNGVKYSLRGEEHIIVDGGSYGGETPPVPDYNLKKDKPLLNYMLGKWKSISTTKIN